MAQPADPPSVHGLTDLEDAELAALVAQLGGKSFQARQVTHWIYRHGAVAAAGLRNLPAPLRDALLAHRPIRSSRVLEVSRSSDGTEKLLLGLHDGETIETVLIPEGERLTLCISSQVGCPVACVFCASGLDGVRRNLSSGEIVEQVLHARDRVREADQPESTRRITNVVVMGLGEPLLNAANLERALARLCDESGIGLGARRITVSTSGHPERMRRFAALRRSYGLALSLHAADDDLRKRLVPTARAPVAELVEAAQHYFEVTGREVTYEVVLLADVNDRPQDATALIDVLRGRTCTINLIPWNPVDRIEGLRRPDAARVDAFERQLVAGGLNVTVRRQRGSDRDAACGQLRLQRAP